MKRLLSVVAMLLAIVPAISQTAYIDTTLRPEVHTILFHPADAELESPLIHLGTHTRLMLQFDVFEDEPQQYRYRIVHCDRHFVADNLTPQEYIYGLEEGFISNYQFSFTTIQSYISYTQTLPDDNSDFLISGNYALEVFLEDDPDSVILTRRFRVTENLLMTEMNCVMPRERPKENQEVELTIGLKSSTERSWANPFYLFPILQQNGRLDLTRELPFSGYQGDKMCYRFKDENIFPGGNCFRFFDFSNIRTPMYNVAKVERFGGETFVMLNPCEVTARKNYNYTEGINGGFKINVWDRTNPNIEADYGWVNISLPMEHPYMDGTVHVVGALTDWSLGECSRMEYNTKLKAYTKRIYLKQGYYAYQLLFLPLGDTMGETGRIEGDHYETPNTYTLYVYGRRPGDRYDRLMSVKEITR